MTDLSEVLKDHSFASKDRLLAAMATIDPPCKTDADLEAYDGRRLLSTPPDARTRRVFVPIERKTRDVGVTAVEIPVNVCCANRLRISTTVYYLTVSVRTERSTVTGVRTVSHGVSRTSVNYR